MFARFRAIKIDHMQPFGTSVNPTESYLNGVISIVRHLIEASLLKTDTLAASEINCGINYQWLTFNDDRG